MPTTVAGTPRKARYFPVFASRRRTDVLKPAAKANDTGGPMRQFLLALAALLPVVPAAMLAAMLTAAPAQAQSASYRIQPGDMLQLTVLEDASLNGQLLVTPDGRVSVPLAGTIRVAGQTVDTVETIIADQLASNFAVRPTVFVALTSVDPSAGLFEIFVLGEVTSPGAREVRAGTTLLQALALAGGPDRFAATKRIQLRRTDPSTGQERLYLFNYNAVERGGSIQSMIALREGDVIIVPERRLFE
jgi:polysaccharide export outer membrane protein